MSKPRTDTTVGALVPITLQGKRVVLEPLAQAHCAELAAAVRDGELWKLWYTDVPSPERMAAEIDRRLAEQSRGAMLPFAVVDGASGAAVGMTTYLNLELEHGRLEIGATWYRVSAQRTALNTECKQLLLTHAFETLDCIAVEFRTHYFNAPSRRAIERLGAKLDGILRSHRRARDGSLRDTCVYSIVASEWPAVRANLRFQLEHGRAD